MNNFESMIIDPIAQTFGLPNCLITPIAAKSVLSLEKYVGKVEKYNECVLIIHCNNYAPNNEFDIWNHPRAGLLNSEKQLWVDVEFKGYKKAYETIFSEYNISQDIFIDHIMNRKLARIFDYKYVRLIHVKNTTNTSSGRGPETLSVKGNSNIEKVKEIQKDQEINYADPFDLIKMLDIPTGGRPFLDVRDVLPVFYDGELLEIFYRERIINLLKDIYGFNAYKKDPVLRKVTKEKLFDLKKKIDAIENEILIYKKNKKQKISE